MDRNIQFSDEIITTAVDFDRVCFQQDGCPAHNPAKGYFDQVVQQALSSGLLDLQI